MSTAYINGGIDREPVSWTSEPGGTAGLVDRSLLQGFSPPIPGERQSSSTAFVYGGLDRASVEVALSDLARRHMFSRKVAKYHGRSQR